MIKTLFKPFMFISVCVALLAGSVTAVQAEPFDSNVKDCLEAPEKCGQEAETKQDGQTGQDQQTERTETVGVTIWDMLKMMGALLLVVALIYFLLRFVNKNTHSYQQTKVIQHLGGSSLGGNRSIQVVKTGDRLFILGVGENIQLIKELDDPKEVEHIVSQYNDQVDQLLQPKDALTNILNKWKKKDEHAKSQSNSFETLFEEKLSELKRDRKEQIEKITNKEKKRDE